MPATITAQSIVVLLIILISAGNIFTAYIDYNWHAISGWFVSVLGWILVLMYWIK